MRGNVPRVLLSACTVIKRAKPVIIVAYTPAGRRARLCVAMQNEPAPCSCALHRYRYPTLQTPYQSPLSLGAFTFQSRQTWKWKECAESETTAGGEIKDGEAECVFRNRRNSWKGYEQRISNNVFGLSAACVRSAAGGTVWAEHLRASADFSCWWSNRTSCWFYLSA